MKAIIWTSRTYRDDLREPQHGSLRPLIGRESHTSEQLRSRKTWDADNGSSTYPCTCVVEPQATYNNCIPASLCPTSVVVIDTLGQVVDRFMGWEVIAG